MGATLVLLTLFFSTSGIGQSLFSGVSIKPSRFPYPGLFDAEITLSNSILLLTRPIACDTGVAIIPAAPQSMSGDEQITPVFVWIPPRVPDEMIVVSCTVPSSIGSLSLTITVGPRLPPPEQPPKGPPPPCDRGQTDQIAYEPGEKVTITYANNCLKPIQFGSKSPWFIYSYNGDTGRVVYTPPVQLEITVVQAGQELKWQWEQRDNKGHQVPQGEYYIVWFTPLGGRGYYSVGGIAITELPDPRLLMRFDTFANGVIDDEELLSVVDLWTAGSIKDELLFAVIDAWVSQTAVRGFGASFKAVPLALNARTDAITFLAKGLDITGMAVEIFDLRGQRIFARQAEGTRLIWNLTAESGQPVANGVYLYVVTMRTLDGLTHRSGVGKLVVLR